MGTAIAKSKENKRERNIEEKNLIIENDKIYNLSNIFRLK